MTPMPDEPKPDGYTPEEPPSGDTRSGKAPTGEAAARDAAPEEAIPEDRVAGILARAAELDRARIETSSVDALRAAALEAGISQSALDVALAEYARSLEPKPKAALKGKPRPKGSSESSTAPESKAISSPTSTAPDARNAAADSAPGEKSEKVGILLSVFLGGFGGHRFYLKDKKGFLYLPFFWTFVPTVVGLVEAFFMRDRVRAFNRRIRLDSGGGTGGLERGIAPGEPAPETRNLPGAEQTRVPCPRCAELILPQASICRFCHSDLSTWSRADG